MKKLLMAAAALTIALATAPGFVSSSEAASAKAKKQAAAAPKSQFCELAKNQRNAPSWNEYYGCLKTPARQAYARAPEPAPQPVRAAGPAPQSGPNSEYCKLAKNQRNAPSWNAYYGCLRR